MNLRARYATLLISAYLVFVIGQLPAAHVVHWVQAGAALPIGLYQVDGTLWRGQARTVIIAQQAAGAFDWTFRPFALLTGRIEFQLAVDKNGGRVDTIAGRSLDGTRYLRETRLEMPLNDVTMLAGQPDMGLAGRVSADLRRASLSAAGIAALEGRIEVIDAGVGPPLNIKLGGFTMDIETGDDVIRGTLKDNKGPLQTDGVFTLNQDGSYRFNATLSARDPANVEMVKALRMIGTPGVGGRVTLTQQGRIALPLQ